MRIKGRNNDNMTEKGWKSKGEIIIIWLRKDEYLREKYSTDNMTEKGGESKGEIMIIWLRKDENLREK